MYKSSLKLHHIYYNPDKDVWLLIENWGNNVSGFVPSIEVFVRKSDSELPVIYQGRGLVVYEATDELLAISEVEDSYVKGFTDRGLLGNVGYLTSRYGGGGNTEVDLVIPRYAELVKKLKRVATINSFAKLAYIYDDVIYSPRGVKK